MVSGKEWHLQMVELYLQEEEQKAERNYQFLLKEKESNIL